MIGVSGPGLWPGLEPLEAQLAVFGDLSDTPDGVRGLPFLPHLPARGVGADDLGRTASLLTDIPVELGSHGWKLADHAGTDLSKARRCWEHDLETLAIAGVGHRALTVHVVGPWTLVATLFLARGDRVLADFGAVHDVAQSLGQGIAVLIDRIRALVPDIALTVQFDESLLSQVNVGAVSTFSGYSRLPAVRGPELVDVLSSVFKQVHECDVQSVVHLGSAWEGIPVVALSGAGAVGVTLGAWNEQGWGLAARALERGVALWSGLPPALVAQRSGSAATKLAELISVPWGRIGLAPRDLNRLTLTQAPRFSDLLAPAASASWAATGNVEDARKEIATLIRVARILAERANG